MKLSMYKGNNYERTFAFTDSDGNAIDVSTWALTLNIHATLEAGSPSITLDSANTPLELDMTDASSGEVTMKLVPADTSSLDAGKYHYDIRRVLDGKVLTLVVDTFLIISPVSV